MCCLCRCVEVVILLSRMGRWVVVVVVVVVNRESLGLGGCRSGNVRC